MDSSPYACAPVIIDCGPGFASYHVPKHLLRSPKWAATDAGGTVQLHGVSAATGHTLVHYLYTDTYQPLEAKGKDVASPTHIKFEQALMAFNLAFAYELPDFEGLAKEQIKIIGGSMTLDEVLHTAKKWFPKMARSWFHEYLQTRAKEQFNLDYRYFTHGAYIESVGDGKLQSFMAHFLLDVFTKKLTHTLQSGESLDEEPTEVVVDGVEDAADQSEVCFEFVDASREDTVAVISLGDQAWHETTHVPPKSTPMASPKPLTEFEAQPKLAPGLPPAEQEWVGHKEKGEEERLAKEAEEEVERKRKEEEEAAAAADAAAAATKAADLRWANETPANDDWGSFAATTTGKKKKGKKGKAEPTPPPLPPPAELPTTSDDTKLDDEDLDDGAPKIDMNFSDPGAAKSAFGFGLGSIGGWSSGWGSSNKTSGWGGFDDSSKDAGGDNPWGSDKKKKESSAFDFDFDAFKGSSEAAPPAEEKPPEDDGWGFGATTTKKKKGKKGALIAESIPEPEPAPAPEPEKKEEDDPWAFSFGSTGKDKKKKKKGAVEEPPPEREPEPVREPTPPPPEPEPEPVEDEPAVDPFAGLSKSQKKKLRENMKKEVKAKEEEDAKCKEEKEAAEDVRQVEEAEAERIRLEEEEKAEKKRLEEEEAAAAAAAAADAEKKKDDTWGDWGATTTTTKKKKKKKGAVEEEPLPPPPPEPEPEPVVEPEPEPEPVPKSEVVKKHDPWGFASMTDKKKKKKKKGVVEEEPPPPPSEPEPEPLVEPELSPPAEEKPADGWDDWGAATTTTKKKKKKRGVIEEEPPPPQPEPEPEPEPVVNPESEPIPEPELVENKKNGDDWDFSSIWGGGKKKKDFKKGTRVEEEEKPGMEVVAMEEEEYMHETMTEISRVLCPHRSYHLSEGDGWKSCERWRAMSSDD